MSTANDPDYWDGRLRNWCLYYFGGANLCAVSNLDRVVVDTGYREVLESPLIGEAIDTDRLVQRLQQDQRDAIVGWYWRSGTKEFVARGMGIHRVTLWERVKKAKELLGNWHFEARIKHLKRETEALGSRNQQ